MKVPGIEPNDLPWNLWVPGSTHLGQAQVRRKAEDSASGLSEQDRERNKHGALCAEK